MTSKGKGNGMLGVTVYPSGTAYFGKWLREEGYTGELQVLVQPHCLVVMHPHASYDLFIESLVNAKRAYMVALNDKTVVAQARGDVSGYTQTAALENVLRHVQDLAQHVSALTDEIRRAEEWLSKEKESDADRAEKDRARAERSAVNERAMRGDWGEP